MKIVFFTHPSFVNSKSMSRFARLLMDGMRDKGHTVTCWTPQAFFTRIPVPKLYKKWLGYLDQYIIFPFKVRIRLKQCNDDTLFVFTDNALGPWLPLLADRPHVMHCHDFLALRSALGLIPEHLTSWTGKQYQRFIRSGFSAGKYFVSVSLNTQNDLHRFLNLTPIISEVVYNGLNSIFSPQNVTNARKVLSSITSLDLTHGYLLHVGGNQWYKNRIGVIELYDALCKSYSCKLPLLMIGENPIIDLRNRYFESPFKDNIAFLCTLSDEQICSAYAGASLFLFPSLAEGFGWPIVEAMASGCPVVTTNEAPMTEVAGGAAVLIDRRPATESESISWAIDSAVIIHNALALSLEQRNSLIELGIKNADRFAFDSYVDKIEKIYQTVLYNVT